MFGFDRIISENKKVKSVSASQSNINRRKEKADNFAVAVYMMRNEPDPLKRLKMQMRLADGIYDFEDLK